MKIDGPIVSVVMATYIRDELVQLRQAVESILSQTFTYFELIIVVDGPVFAETYRYLNTLKKKPKVRVLYLEENGGPAKARNVGIKSSIGKYIAIMDSDDISVPRRLELQVKFIEHNKVDVVSTWLQVIDKGGNCVAIRKVPLSSNNIRLLSIIRCPMHNPSLLCLASVLKSNEYDESLQVSEDYDLWVRLLIMRHRVLNMRSVLVQYRQDATNMNKRIGVKYFISDLKVKIKCLKLYPIIFRIIVFVPIIFLCLARLLPLSLFKYLYYIKTKIF